MLWPCSGPKSRVRRINMSSVPWRRSTRVCFPALFSLDITPPVDFRPEYPAAQVECQWETGRMSMGEANFSASACARRLLHWKFSSCPNSAARVSKRSPAGAPARLRARRCTDPAPQRINSLLRGALFAAERDHRVDFRRPSRRDEGGQQGDGDQQGGDGG